MYLPRSISTDHFQLEPDTHDDSLLQLGFEDGGFLYVAPNIGQQTTPLRAYRARDKIRLDGALTPRSFAEALRRLPHEQRCDFDTTPYARPELTTPTAFPPLNSPTIGAEVMFVSHCFYGNAAPWIMVVRVCSRLTRITPINRCEAAVSNFDYEMVVPTPQPA